MVDNIESARWNSRNAGKKDVELTFMKNDYILSTNVNSFENAIVLLLTNISFFCKNRTRKRKRCFKITS